MSCRCFHCSNPIECAVVSEKPDDVWGMPMGAVQFDGGWNFGSKLYDAGLGGPSVQIVICDSCVLAAKGTDRMREMQGAR